MNCPKSHPPSRAREITLRARMAAIRTGRALALQPSCQLPGEGTYDHGCEDQNQFGQGGKRPEQNVDRGRFEILKHDDRDQCEEDDLDASDWILGNRSTDFAKPRSETASLGLIRLISHVDSGVLECLALGGIDQR